MSERATEPRAPGDQANRGRRRPFPLRCLDPYIAALLGCVAFAAAFPATGRAGALAADTGTGAIALLFFLYGARLTSRQVVQGLRHWRLHLAIALSTFAAFPLLGLAARALVPVLVAPSLYPGLLFLCLLPSTVQSSIAFTSIARGNVPGAVCAGTYSSLLGLVVTPLLSALLLGSAAPIDAGRLTAIAGQLLLPFAAGQVARRWIGTRLERYPAVLRLVDRGSILLVVYVAFSEGTAHGVWHQVTPLRLAGLLMVEAALLAAMLAATTTAAALLRFDRADRIAAVFAGSKKSLVNGLPMATVLFGVRAGLAVLPLMLFHQMQLMVCAALARRWSRAADPVTGRPVPADTSAGLTDPTAAGEAASTGRG